MQFFAIPKHLSFRTPPCASFIFVRNIGGSKGRKFEKLQSNKIVAPLKTDKIGAPHAISNIRPLKLYIPDEESNLHKKYRLLREETQVWNHKFWLTHNQEFAEAKEKFVKKTLADKNCKDPKNNLTNEEMSEFYTQFLNDKWMSHLRYNYEWQKRNFKIAVLSIAVAAQKIIS